jgi:hypothetical protein
MACHALTIFVSDPTVRWRTALCQSPLLHEQIDLTETITTCKVAFERTGCQNNLTAVSIGHRPMLTIPWQPRASTYPLVSCHDNPTMTKLHLHISLSLLCLLQDGIEQRPLVLVYGDDMPLAIPRLRLLVLVCYLTQHFL